MILHERQRRILTFAVVLFTIAGLFPPWVTTFNVGTMHMQKPGGYAFIASPPAPTNDGWGIDIDYSRLIVEWIVLIVASAFGILVPGAQGPGRIEVWLRTIFQAWTKKVKQK